MSDNNTIAKNTLYMTIRMVIVLLINLYASRVVLQKLGIEDYGIYNVVAGFVTMLGFINTSLSNGIQRFFNYELGRRGIQGANYVFNISLLIQFILSIIIILLTETIGMWYLENKMVIPIDRMLSAKKLFHISLLTFVSNIYQVPFIAAVMAHERMGFYSLISVLQAVLSLLAIFIISIVSIDKLVFYGFSLLLISIFLLLLYLWYCRRSFEEIYFSTKINSTLLKEMLSFSGWNIFGTMGAMFKDQGLNLILNFFFGPVVNAARGIALQVNGGLQSFVNNISVPVRPQMIQSYSKGDKERALALTYKISKFSCFALLIMAVPIILEIDNILNIWLGKNVPQYTSSFVILIIVNSFFLNLNAAISGIVHASGKMMLYQVSGFILSVLSILFAFGTLKYTGKPESAFYVFIIMSAVSQVISVIIVKHIESKFSYSKYVTRVLIPVFLVSIVSVFVPSCLKYLLDDSPIRIIMIFLFSVPFSMICIYFMGLEKDEKEIIKDKLRNLKRN